MPNCGITELFRDISKKTVNFTKQDYCIVYIGEEDFKETKDYQRLVNIIRDTLSKLDYTNFIICLPTYRCKNTGIMLNWRIETFNNLLYRDNLKYEYSFLLDSNVELSFEYDMFSRASGYVNNNGVEQIFQGIKKTILYIEQFNMFNQPEQKVIFSPKHNDIGIQTDPLPPVTNNSNITTHSHSFRA